MKKYFPESTGICIGASTVSVVSLKLTSGILSTDKTRSIPHHGNHKTVVAEKKIAAPTTLPLQDVNLETC